MRGRGGEAGGCARRPAPRGGGDRRTEGAPAGRVVCGHPEAVGGVGGQILHVVARARRVGVRLLGVPLGVVRVPDLDAVAVDGGAAVLRRPAPVQFQFGGLDVLGLQFARDARHRDARGCGPGDVDGVAQVAHAQGLQVGVGVVPHLAVGLHREPEVDLAPVGAVGAVLVDAHGALDLEAGIGLGSVVRGQQQLGRAGAAVGVVVDGRAGAAEGAGDGVAAALQFPAAAPVDLLVEVDAGILGVAGLRRCRQGLVGLPFEGGHAVADVAQVVDLAVVDVAHLAVGADGQVEGRGRGIGHGRAILVDLGAAGHGAGHGGSGAETRRQHELGLGVLACVVLDGGAGAAEVGGDGGAGLADGPAPVGVGNQVAEVAVGRAGGRARARAPLVRGSGLGRHGRRGHGGHGRCGLREFHVVAAHPALEGVAVAEAVPDGCRGRPAGHRVPHGGVREQAVDGEGGRWSCAQVQARDPRSQPQVGPGRDRCQETDARGAGGCDQGAVRSEHLHGGRWHPALPGGRGESGRRHLDRQEPGLPILPEYPLHFMKDRVEHDHQGVWTRIGRGLGVGVRLGHRQGLVPAEAPVAGDDTHRTAVEILNPGPVGRHRVVVQRAQRGRWLVRPGGGAGLHPVDLGQVLRTGSPPDPVACHCVACRCVPG